MLVCLKEQLDASNDNLYEAFLMILKTQINNNFHEVPSVPAWIVSWASNKLKFMIFTK